MKKFEIQRMPINKIFSEVGFALQKADVSLSINLKGEKGRDLIDEFRRECPSPKDKEYKNYVEDFLRKNEKNIDKTILIILMLENLTKEVRANQYNPRVNKEGLEQIRHMIARAKEILGENNKKVYKIIENRDKTVYVETVSAQELITEKKEQENHQKLAQLENNDVKLSEILNSIILTDIADLMCDNELGDCIRYQSFLNTAIRKGNIVQSEPIIDSEMTIEELQKGLTYEEILPEAEEAIRNNIEYLDFDKLVLCSAYRYIEYLEEVPEVKDIEEISRRLNGIVSYFEGRNIKIEGRIEKGNYNESNKCEHIHLTYRLKDLKKDMEKFEGTTYWGKAKIKGERQSLLLGEISLRDTNMQRIKLTEEDLMFLATVKDDNYIYLIENKLLNSDSIAKINESKSSITDECFMKLVESGNISGTDVVELYLQGKIDLENLTDLELDISESLTIEDIFLESQKEENDERKERIIELYRKTLLKKDEDLEITKQKVYDAYLETMNAKYLELFFEIGTLELDDLMGIMSGKEWIDALQGGEISEEFFVKLQKGKLITEEEIKGNKQVLNIELKLWEEGKLSSEEFSNLGISIEELLDLCEQAKIKGAKLGELISKEDFTKYERKIVSNYAYGMYDTIRPALAAYNSNILNRDKVIEIIKEMKIPSSELARLCEQGLLEGTKIAELRYKGIITKGQFRKLKEQGLISDKEEIEVANNLTPQEMLKELEENGCTKIENIEEILSAFGHTKRKQGEGKGKSYNKKILNPIKRNQMLEILGTDTIVTTPENGFNRYQAFLIPKLGIAVLEKMFRKNKNEEIKPSYGDATYICEIGKYIQVSGQSKSEIRTFMDAEGSSNGNVDIINHTKQWGENLIKGIQKVNPNISIERKGNEIISIARDKDTLNIDIKELNNIIGLMKQGEFSISLEEYE